VTAPVMGDARFFPQAGPHSAAVIAEASGATVGAGDGERILYGVAPLQTATARDLSFLDNRRYADFLATSAAGAVLVHPALLDRVPPGCVALVTDAPYLGWARATALFHPAPAVTAGIHPSAIIAPSARIDPSAEIGPLVVIGADAEIGAGCQIAAGVVIGASCVLGARCRIGAQSTISHAILGQRVVLYPGVRIGQDGFGFAPGPTGMVSVPQLGLVRIGDAVEIGANSTIDRGSAHDTVVGAGTRIDNLVQIGHNVRIGQHCVIVAQVGISGSALLEDFVVIGGQAGVAGHLTIGRKTRIGAQSGVMADVPAGQDYVGTPAQKVKAFFRQVALLKRWAEPGARPPNQTRAD
jgi:UDP-3-O-[3-hydroxymyristoyl] glucosamine N-acyltransferase